MSGDRNQGRRLGPPRGGGVWSRDRVFPLPVRRGCIQGNQRLHSGADGLQAALGDVVGRTEERLAATVRKTEREDRERRRGKDERKGGEGERRGRKKRGIGNKG